METTGTESLVVTTDSISTYPFIRVAHVLEERTLGSKASLHATGGEST